VDDRDAVALGESVDALHEPIDEPLEQLRGDDRKPETLVQEPPKVLRRRL
jgi:hypothetical protein